MTTRLHSTVATIALLAFACAASSADWTLTTADFKTEPADLVGVEAGGVRVKDAAGAERLVANAQFLQIERTAPASPSANAGAFMLHLIGGDRVGGEPVKIDGDRLVWKNPAVGELAVPLSRLVAMTKPGKNAPEGAGSTEDVVTLGNGDAVRGIIMAVGEGRVDVKNDAGDTIPVPVGSIDSVKFAATPGAAAAVPEKGYRVRLDDGSSVVAESMKVVGTAADTVELALTKETVRPLPLARVAAVELIDGPAAFLSGRPPAESVYVPFFGSEQDYPARMNQTVDGSPDLHFGGRTFRRAIGVHSYSKLTWALDGASYAAFRTQYAIDADRSGADVTVRILVDGKVAHEQKNVRAGALSPVVTVDIAGAKELALAVDYGENLHVNDHLTWLEPALLKSKPAAK